MTDFSITCEKCDNNEDAKLELGASDSQGTIINKFNKLNKFHVKQEGSQAMLLCGECEHSTPIIKDELSNVSDMAAHALGYTERLMVVKMLGRRSNTWFTILFLSLIGVGVLIGVDNLIVNSFGLNITRAISLLIIFTFIFLHELCHYTVSKFLGYRPTLHLLSNSYTEPFKRGHGLTVTLAPLVILTVTYLTMIVTGSVYAGAAFIAMIFNIDGSKQDIKQAIAIYKCPRGSYVFGDFKNEVRAYQKDDTQ